MLLQLRHESIGEQNRKWIHGRLLLPRAHIPTLGNLFQFRIQKLHRGMEKYREYVREGIGQGTIWEELAAQCLLGTKGFAEALKDRNRGKRRIRDIPRGQRLISRPSVKKLFDQKAPGKAKRDRLIAEAVYRHGYSQTEVARHPRLHYSTVSRLIKPASSLQPIRKNKDFSNNFFGSNAAG